MSTAWIAIVYGLLVTSAILVAALFVSAPDGTTLLLAMAIGVVVSVGTYFRERQR